MSDEKIVKVNYSGNSHKDRDRNKEQEKTPDQEERKIEKIEGVSAVKRKKPLGRKIAETFTGDDMGSVGSYVLFDVALPALKNLIVDVATQGIERAFFGTALNRGPSSLRGRSGYTPYNTMSSGSSLRSSREPERDLSRRARANHDFDEIVIPSRGLAEEVLERLGDLIDEYGVATVADMYQLVDTTGSFSDQKWGWTDLRDARVRPVRSGYLLDLPRPKPID